MNEVKLTGKVLNCYIHDKTGALITRIAVTHDHVIGTQKIVCESVFNVVMSDINKIKNVDVMQGDKVMITGHLKLDHKHSLSGNDHQKVMVYADEIEVIKSKSELDVFDYTRHVLGM